MIPDSLVVYTHLINTTSSWWEQNIIPIFTIVAQFVIVYILYRLHRKLEATKSELSKEIVEYQTKYSYYHNRQFDGLVKLYRALQKAYRHVLNLKESDKADFGLLIETINICNDNCLFIDTIELREEVNATVVNLSLCLDPEGKILPEILEFETTPKKVVKAAARAKEKLPSLIQKLEEIIRGIIAP